MYCREATCGAIGTCNNTGDGNGYRLRLIQSKMKNEIFQQGVMNMYSAHISTTPLPISPESSVLQVSPTPSTLTSFNGSHARIHIPHD